ncbi:MAG: ribosomal L7Ae/L30e/S12e/Gadd45 family protein [Oscillospiraceae bacterium]|nr:ribosomal L7Ae/L30e/S12e/Gadd45 family protein [Oscillospiraceae bacterium]
MNYQTKFFNLLTICEKSGNLIKGFDTVKEALQKNGSGCVFICQDLSQRTRKEIDYICSGMKNTDVINLPFDMDQVGVNIGKKVGVMAVCDQGFAAKLKQYASAITESAGSDVEKH